MNKRIRELWNEAAASNLDDSCNHEVAFMDRFAKLIVKECAGVNYNSVFKDGEFHAREVLEHFGVEE